MFNVELYNRTARSVVASCIAATEAGASEIARDFISRTKAAGTVIHESCLDISPRGYVIGQTIIVDDVTYDVTTGRM